LPDGLIIAAPRSGSGKTVLTLGLAAALRSRGKTVAPAKTGPDYIDATILGRVAGRDAINLDPWAMRPLRLQSLAAAHAGDADLLLIEGVMGLFDGAADGAGSTGDLAEALSLPVVLVIDADRQSQSIAPLAAGFADWRPGVRIAGIILNRVASPRHELMLRNALEETGIPCLGALPREAGLAVPERHLGLVLPAEFPGFDAVASAAKAAVGEHVDLDQLLALAAPLPPAMPGVTRLAPLGQYTAIASDEAFAFVYSHWLEDWRALGAEFTFFSPLADEPPSASADAVYLPGGYPELHAARLAECHRFKAGLASSRDRGAVVYGECGGYMVLGKSLTDHDGTVHEMAGLLPLETSIANPRRRLGYRRLTHKGRLPWPDKLLGHEFHYSSGEAPGAAPLFEATDALGNALPPMGAVAGRVMGSYAHVIDAA
jgi:cobyrinic acid a,c-diamide synthase